MGVAAVGVREYEYSEEGDGDGEGESELRACERLSATSRRAAMAFSLSSRVSCRRDLYIGLIAAKRSSSVS